MDRRQGFVEGGDGVVVEAVDLAQLDAIGEGEGLELGVELPRHRAARARFEEVGDDRLSEGARAAGDDHVSLCHSLGLDPVATAHKR